MAEPFGIVSGAVGVTAIFTTCVDCFGYVQSARKFDRDFQTELVHGLILQNRLSRWGEAISIYDSPKFGDPQKEALAKAVLLQILKLFDDSMAKSGKYIGQDLEPLNRSSTAANDKEITQEALSEVENTMQALIKKRKKGTGLLKKIGWSLYDKKSLIELNSNLSKLMDGLDSCVPTEESRAGLVENEMEEVKSDEKVLEALAVLSEKLDGLLHNEADRKVEEVRTFQEVIIDGGQVHNGGLMKSDFHGTIPTGDGGCTIGKMHVKGGKVHNGWNLGGKGVFDD